MAKTRVQKTEEVEQLTELLSKAKGIYLTDFTKMNVETMTALRRRLRESDVTYRVVKNSLMAKALGGIGVTGIETYFGTPTALAVSITDELAPARVLADFRKKFNMPEIKAGIVEGTFYGGAQVETLAGLPPKPELISRFMSVVQGPARGLAVVLMGPVRQLVVALKAIEDKKGQPEKS